VEDSLRTAERCGTMHVALFPSKRKLHTARIVRRTGCGSPILAGAELSRRWLSTPPVGRRRTLLSSPLPPKRATCTRR
jgi:hypothetical protein